jgi:hypothetical protein
MTRPDFALPLMIAIVWSPLTATVVRSADNSPLFAVAVSPAVKLAIAGGERGLVIVRDLATGAKLRTLHIATPIYGLVRCG